MEEETNLHKYLLLPNVGFRSYSTRTEKGNSKDYRTPFYNQKTSKTDEDTPRKTILNSWTPQLEKLENSLPGLYKYENDMLAKVGPMSIQLPLNERWPKITEYWEAIHSPSTPLPESALNAVCKEWRQVSGIRLRSQAKTVANMRLSTNSGTPYFNSKRRNVLDDTFPCSLEIRGNEVISHLPTKDWQDAAILGWRGQEGGPSPELVKQRTVFMFPLQDNAEELRAYQPLIESAQRFGLVPAWVSGDAVDERMTKLFDTKGEHDLVICTDFTGFDQHFNRDMRNGAHYILKRLLTNDADSAYWLNEVFPIKYMIPLIAGDRVLTGEHGMGSGSGGTNFDETLSHRALQYEAAQRVNKKLNPNSMCLGDDGVLSFPGINVDLVTQVYSAHGQDMNAQKQDSSEEEAVYLRRWYNRGYRIDGICRGVYATTRAIGRLCAQERYYDPDKWGPEMVTIRYLSIIENCKWHPLFTDFVDWCIKGDRCRLGLAIPGFLDKLAVHVKEAIDLMPDFLGYVRSQQKFNPKDVEEWHVVKYLRENYDAMK